MVKNLPTVERSTKIRFGKHALEDQAENTIVFNASDTELQASTAGAVYLTPIRSREDFSDSQIVLLMYNKTTGEITESGSAASTAVEPPLSLVTSYGKDTPHTIEFTNPTTAFTTVGNVHINGDLEIQGNVQFTNGTITEIKNTDLVVEDRIIGIANNNTQTGLDTGIIMNYPNQNVGIIHHGDENPKRLSIGYTQNSSTDTAITPDSNNITLDVLGDLKVQNNAVIGDQMTTNSLSVTTTVSAVTGTFSGDVSGVVGTFSGAVSGTSVTDGTGTLSGGAWSGSAATLTNARTIGGVSFDGSQNIVPTTFGDISATDGTFTGNVEAVTGAFEGTLSSAAFTATSAEITTGNLTVNTNAILVDAANKKVGIGKTPVANLDVLGNVYASGGITSADLITGDGGGLSNIQVSSLASDVALGTDTSGDYVQTVSGGDGVTVTGGTGESSTPSVALDLKADGGLVIETNELALKLDATSITWTLAVADGGTGVTTKTGTGNVVLSDSPTLTGTLTGEIADFSGAVTGASYSGGAISGTTGTFTGAVQGASYSGGAISGTTGLYTGVLTVSDNTPATSNATGALVVSGGIGAIGNVYSGDLYASAGLDHCSYIGTSKIGYDGTNTGDATFAHYSNMNGTDYAIKQDSTGATKINAKTGYGISLGINNTENVGVTSAGDFKVNANTLYVDASGERVGIRTSSPAVNRTLDVVGNVYASQNITAAGSLTVNDGLIINAGGVTKKFYSFNGEIPHNTVVDDAAIKLTFSSNIFYAKIVAHLVEDSTEFSNMSLEVGGGSRAGGANPTLKLGSVSVFGNTSTNPWQSTPVLGASTITIKPSSTINDGGGSATALYNLFIEYITPDATNGKLLTIHLGTNATAIKTFNY